MIQGEGFLECCRKNDSIGKNFMLQMIEKTASWTVYAFFLKKKYGQLAF